jgi:hypothetical protein
MSKFEYYRSKSIPSLSQPCLCGSGKKFKRCCGNQSARRKPPQGLHVIRDFVDQQTCQKWVDYLGQRPHEPLPRVDPKRSSVDNLAYEFDGSRITDNVSLGDRRPEMHGLVRRAYDEQITPVFERDLEWFEYVQVLRYTTGGKYTFHADSERYDHDKRDWFKSQDRDVSLLIYLNEEFTGGTLDFVFFNYTYQPRRGDLVFFPSDHRYSHWAQTVTSGIRYAIVSWAAFSDEPRVHSARPPLHVLMGSDQQTG